MASLSLILIIGFATFFNLSIVLHKIKKGKFINAALDLSTLVVISILFSGSISGLAVGMIASMGFSIYLLFIPLKLSNSNRIQTYRRKL